MEHSKLQTKECCPRCTSSRLVRGRGIYDSDTNISGFFVPQLKWWKLIRSYAIAFKAPLCACADCGLVWSDIDVKELRNLISQAGKDDTKKQLGLGTENRVLGYAQSAEVLGGLLKDQRYGKFDVVVDRHGERLTTAKWSTNNAMNRSARKAAFGWQSLSLSLGYRGRSSLKICSVEYDDSYNCHCILRLASGREVVLDKLTQSRTYAGLLEGNPNKKSNDLSIRWLLERIARDNPDLGEPYLIEPPRRDYFLDPGDMQSDFDRQRHRPDELKHIPEWLPQIVCIGEFRSLQPARDDAKHASSLIIVWYQNDFGLDSIAMESLRTVDWENHATDWEYGVRTNKPLHPSGGPTDSGWKLYLPPLGDRWRSQI